MKSIGIDFDGVIHAYRQGWQDGSIYDEPVPGAFEVIKAFQAAGHPVFIFTSRDNLLDVAQWVHARSGIPCCTADFEKPFWDDASRVLVTNRKLGAALYIDDRGYRFRDWASCQEEVTRLLA